MNEVALPAPEELTFYKGHFKNKIYSTISDSIEVGCNYSGDHGKGQGNFTEFQECMAFPRWERSLGLSMQIWCL